MADVVILGAGGMGREAHAWLLDQAADGTAIHVLGYLDDDRSRVGTAVAGLPVLGGVEWLDAHAASVVVAIGDTRARRDATAEVRRRGRPTMTVVHPTAVVGPRVAIGAGCIIAPGSIITVDVELGAGVIVNFGAVIGHDTSIGDFVNVAPGAAVAGRARLDEGADLGIGASVVQGRRIGAWAVVGGGAVVTRSILPGVTAVGVPARPLPVRQPA